MEPGSINSMSWNVLDLLTTVQKLSCVATPGNTGAVDLPGLLLVWHFFLSAWDLHVFSGVCHYSSVVNSFLMIICMHRSCDKRMRVHKYLMNVASKRI